MNMTLPLVGTADGKFQKSAWYASTEDRCAMSESAPIVDATGKTVMLVVEASDTFADTPAVSERAEFVVRACNMHAALLEFFKATNNFEAASGSDGTTVEAERAAEARFDAARSAVRVALLKAGAA